MPRNMRKYKKTKLMRMFRLDEKRDDVFPDVQTAVQKKECLMDLYTLSIANKWIKEKSGAVVQDCQCGSPECQQVHSFNIELQTLKDMWSSLINIESIRAQNSSFPYLSVDDFFRLMHDMGLKLKKNEITDIINIAKQEEDGIVMIFESMLALADKIFQREENPYKPNELLKKLIKMYLRPL